MRTLSFVMCCSRRGTRATWLVLGKEGTSCDLRGKRTVDRAVRSPFCRRHPTFMRRKDQISQQFRLKVKVKVILINFFGAVRVTKKAPVVSSMSRFPIYPHPLSESPL